MAGAYLLEADHPQHYHGETRPSRLEDPKPHAQSSVKQLLRIHVRRPVARRPATARVSTPATPGPVTEGSADPVSPVSDAYSQDTARKKNGL